MTSRWVSVCVCVWFNYIGVDFNLNHLLTSCILALIWKSVWLFFQSQMSLNSVNSKLQGKPGSGRHFPDLMWKRGASAPRLQRSRAAASALWHQPLKKKKLLKTFDCFCISCYSNLYVKQFINQWNPLTPLRGAKQDVLTFKRIYGGECWTKYQIFLKIFETTACKQTPAVFCWPVCTCERARRSPYSRVQFI